MRIVVVGGGGLIGARLVSILHAAGHDVHATSPRPGLNTSGGECLLQIPAEAEVVVDVAIPPSFRSLSAMEFFASLSRDLLAAEAAARVQHHIVLSMIGVDRLGSQGYFRAKAAQEQLIRASLIPYTIVRAAQCLEFVDESVRVSVQNETTLRIPVALVQPIAAHDLAEALAAIVTTPPKNGTIEVVGPEAIYLHELARLILSAREVPHGVLATPQARYFGASLGEESLMPGPDAQIGSTTPRDWLRTFIKPG